MKTCLEITCYSKLIFLLHFFCFTTIMVLGFQGKLTAFNLILTSNGGYVTFRLKLITNIINFMTIACKLLHLFLKSRFSLLKKN